MAGGIAGSGAGIKRAMMVPMHGAGNGLGMVPITCGRVSSFFLTSTGSTCAGVGDLFLLFSAGRVKSEMPKGRGGPAQSTGADVDDRRQRFLYRARRAAPVWPGHRGKPLAPPERGA